MIQKLLLISGKVQNVGFRHWLYMKVTKKNIRGWVKNNTTGKVEVLLIGDDDEVNDIIKQCKKGPDASNVTQVEIWDYQQKYIKKSFDILNAS